MGLNKISWEKITTTGERQGQDRSLLSYPGLTLVGLSKSSLAPPCSWWRVIGGSYHNNLNDSTLKI